MSRSLGTTPVSEIVHSPLFTVGPVSKLDAVARKFELHNINAAPVVDGLGKCLGIITSHNLVQYEAHRTELERQFQHGLAFDVGHYNEGGGVGIFGRPFDEVAYHMTTDFIAVEASAALSHAARLMCREHVHHLVTLDGGGRPIGIISSLDILSDLVGEPVCGVNVPSGSPLDSPKIAD